MPELSQEEENRLLEIRRKYRIDPERFRQGYVFATLVEEGETRVDAYMIAFGVNRIKATQNATRLYGSGWIQCILGEIELDQSARAKEDIETIREEMRAILISPESEHKDKVAAAKVLEGISKKKEKKEELSGGEETLAAQIINNLKKITSGTQMIGYEGKVIDVPILE
jgi:hypothetical protein